MNNKKAFVQPLFWLVVFALALFGAYTLYKMFFGG